MNKFKITLIMLSSIILFSCDKTEPTYSQTDVTNEYENIKDLSELTPIQGVAMNDNTTEKYTAEIDNSCNTNIQCNIENAYYHYDAMNKDLQRNPSYQPVYHKNINGIFALQCGSDLIKNIARYRISNEIRIDVITRNGEHFWCKGGYNLVSFLRGRRVQYMNFNNSEKSINPITDNTSDNIDFDNSTLDNNNDNLDNVDFDSPEFNNEFETDCGETDCEFIDENGYDNGL